MLYPTCTQLLIVQLPATGVSRPFPWGAGELGPPEIGLAAKLSGGAGGGGHPTCPVGPTPTSPREQKASPDRGVCASLESLLPVGAASQPGTVPPRARQALSATMGMAEAFQSPSACFNYCCVLTVNSSGSLFSDCQFLVLTNPFQAGGRMGRRSLMTISDQKDVL